MTLEMIILTQNICPTYVLQGKSCCVMQTVSASKWQEGLNVKVSAALKCIMILNYYTHMLS